MEVLKEAQEATGSAMILITHDLGLVAGVADRIIVMYGGHAFEEASTETLFYEPMNPYTRGLLRSIPRLSDTAGVRLAPIPGSPPSILTMPDGCAFAPRCAMRADICSEPAPVVEVGPSHTSRCHRVAELGPFEAVESTELPV
jgi:oligopeptide/dipeptide ABC transporter ATP-binding protein